MSCLSIVRAVAIATLLWPSMLPAEPNKPLTISVGDWPPFFVKDEPGQGVVARLVRDVFAEEGYDVTFHFLPWKRAYREALNGQHDATAIWMHTEERERSFVYSAPVMQERYVLFHRKDKHIQWETLDDLSDLKLGANDGYSYGPSFDEALKTGVLSVEREASPALNFRKLIYGRIDAFPEEINVGYYILRKDGLIADAKRITHHPRALLENESFLLFTRGDPDTPALVAAFNRRLTLFRETGRYDAYFDNRPQAALGNP